MKDLITCLKSQISCWKDYLKNNKVSDDEREKILDTIAELETELEEKEGYKSLEDRGIIY